MYRMEKFSDFIVEQKDEAYKLIVFNNSNEDVRDVGKRTRPDFKLLVDSAKKVGIQIFNVEYTGLYISESGGKIFLNSLDFDEDGNVIMPTESGEAKYQKPIEINSENTLIFARGLGTFGYTTNRRWVDIIRGLEDRGFNAAVLMSEGFDQIYNLLSGIPGLAEGGRIGYKDGPEKPGRRTFMKAAAGLASLLPFGMGKISKVAAPAVAKAAEISGPALAKIVDTVMSLGKLVSVQGKRVKEMVTKKKHQGVEVTEDIQDGSYVIKKGDKEIYYKPGRQDETGGFDDDIIEVIEKRIEKAGGGIGYMLGE